MQGKSILITVISLFVAALIISGCSGKGSPGSTLPLDTPPGNDILEKGSTGFSGQASLGAFEVTLDTNNMTWDVKPLVRTAGAIGDNYQLDATKYFNDSPCTNCFRVDKFGIDGSGNMIVDFAMKHPFADTTKRLDLDAFDVKLILISNAEAQFGDTSFPLSGEVDSNGDGITEILRGNTKLVLNPDGFTTHLDMVAELPQYYPPDGLALEGNLNPYKFFFTEDNPDPVLEGTEIDNHRMKQGADWDYKRFVMKFPSGGGVIRFVTAIEVAYGQSAVRYTRLFPVYWLPQYNQKEAFKITVTDTTNSLNTQYNSNTIYRIEVCDWQNYFLQDITYPNSDNLIGLEYPSDIFQCRLEIPLITPSVLSQNAPGLGGTGRSTDPMIFEIQVDNFSNPSVPAGTYPGLVTIVDTHDKQIVSVQNDPYFPEYIDDIRAYQVFEANVYPMTNFNVLVSAEGVDTGLTIGAPCIGDLSIKESQADLGVFNNGTTSGVYMATPNSDIVKFALDYSNAPWDGTTIFAPGSSIVDTCADRIHPCNTGGPLPNQMINRIDAADSGAFIISNSDDNFSVKASQINPALTVCLPNSALVRPYDQYGAPSFFFVGGCGSAGTPAAPALGERVYDVFEDASDHSGINPLCYLTAGPGTQDCGDTIDAYYINEPYNSAFSIIRRPNLNYLLSPGPFDWNLIYNTSADTGTDQAGGTRKLLWILSPDTITPAVKGINILDDPIAATYTTFLLDATLTPVDLQVLEFDPANPRALNGIGQSGDWICVLYRENIVDIFAEDGTPLDRINGSIGSGTEDDGTLGFYGEARHLDCDDYLYRIHVSIDSNGKNNAGGNVFVSVFSM